MKVYIKEVVPGLYEKFCRHYFHTLTNINRAIVDDTPIKFKNIPEHHALLIDADAYITLLPANYPEKIDLLTKRYTHRSVVHICIGSNRVEFSQTPQADDNVYITKKYPPDLCEYLADHYTSADRKLYNLVCKLRAESKESRAKDVSYETRSLEDNLLSFIRSSDRHCRAEFRHSLVNNNRLMTGVYDHGFCLRNPEAYRTLQTRVKARSCFDIGLTEKGQFYIYIS